MFFKIFFILLAILISVKIGLCSWRIYIRQDKLSVEYYLSIIDWKREFLKIAVLALVAKIISFFLTQTL